MSLFKRICIFVFIFVLFFQIGFPYLVPDNIVFSNRIKYNIFKSNADSIEAVLQKIKSQISRQQLKDYVIILGDSVGFSSPCESNESIGYHLNRLAEKSDFKVQFFNLSIPSEYPGDVYTIIKLLDKYGISTQNLIINFNYFEFATTEAATGVFWFKNQLKDVDKHAYAHIYGKFNEKKPVHNQIKDSTMRFLNKNISLLLYRDFIRKHFSSIASDEYVDLIGDPRPWYEKNGLKEKIKSSDYLWYFSDEPFVMDESRAQIYFINKILKHQEGKNTLVFLAAYNRELLKEETSKDGYNNNLKMLKEYFESKDVIYVDYDRKIDYKLYSDFVHLTPEGYKVLSEDLWVRVRDNFFAKQLLIYYV